jgi:hypothetical protein
MEIKPKKKQEYSKLNSQVIGFRLNKKDWDKLKLKCTEKNIPMSKVLQNAVEQFMKEK